MPNLFIRKGKNQPELISALEIYFNNSIMKAPQGHDERDCYFGRELMAVVYVS